MQKRTYYIFSLLFLSLCGMVIAQEEDNIGTETVTVVKPYSPTVSDAFKIKSSPSLNDSIVLQKKKINYSIFSVPVASTFTPAKGKASGVEKTPPPTLYNSYASVGLGNYNNALVDFYTSREFNRGEDLLDFGLTHNSSRGDLDSTPLETDFYDTELNASYAKKDRYMDWGAAIGLQHQLYNWYGIQSELFSEDEINAMDETQNYFNAEAKAHFNMEDSYFKSGNILLRRFWDATESAENRAVINPTFELPITEELITISAKVDYVGGNFKNGTITESVNDGEKNYSHLQAGVNPSLLILRDDLTLNLGANIVYGLDMENSENNFYIYPSVTASYRVMDENVIAYGGIEGELKQNSYHDFVDDNPYVSPTLDIVPTDQQYEGYLGLKGQLTSNVGYNIKGSYMAENRKPLFYQNTVNTTRTDEKSYYYGNSFQVFYDDVKTLGVFGEINVDVNRNFSLGVNAEFYDYDTETDNPAWNLPSIKGSLFMDYQITDQWYMGANLFYVGERDALTSVVLTNNVPPSISYTQLTLDSFFDANAHIGYRFNEQLSIFVKASNIANNNYQRWANFRVQGFQALAGVSYKFDF
ncbi:MAG: TonB-dependent receptor [Bacteroidota bacterium]|uniref:TonB-dependent receptor n=1 Tax=Flagellimonas profundi TaxID=2915620 RepID=A0ABS3FK29_9FLAO|nr:TonB-dependent receptor [Allomuricauda profundi]MBO0343524.1 TonB-dependent receptor [Allomuricauda profundi]MEC7771614.1 TonB-dependent receptor [Bacteroidota bacterium]